LSVELNQRKYRLLVLAHLLVNMAVVVMAGSATGTPLTVCDIMAHPGRYRDQIVSVRGWIREDREWSALVSTRICENRLRTKGAEWSPWISTITPEYYQRLTGRAVPFQQTEKDRQALRELERLKIAHDEVVVATFVGLLRTKSREEYDAIQLPDGRWVPVNGYGHLGAYFAELVVKTVRDITVVSADEVAYGVRRDSR